MTTCGQFWALCSVSPRLTAFLTVLGLLLMQSDMIGGGAGFIGMGASFAAARYARAGAVKAGSARTKAAIDKLADGPTKDGLQKRLDDSITTAEAMLAKQSKACQFSKRPIATVDFKCNR